jgi:hypothetical protein
VPSRELMPPGASSLASPHHERHIAEIGGDQE